MNPKILLQEAHQQKETLVAHRRFLHTHPGTGFDIPETVAYVRRVLTELGYDPQHCGRGGLTALVGGKRPGKVFLLRADMDALPIAEEAEVDFPATNGKMHACGHDLHTAMLLGAAKLLKDHENELCGTVKLMFQPAEECFEGAQDMIASGLLENPKVDGAMMIHVMAGMSLPSGSVIVCDGGVSAPAGDYFTICIQGKGCHGSMPNHGVDPITVAAHVITGLQEITARELSIAEEAVLTIGSIHGGDAANVIPDVVELNGTLRTYDETVRAFLKQRMEEITQGVAATFRASAQVIFGSGCPTLVNDRELSQCVTRAVKELLGERNAFSADQLGGGSRSTGSEDFAYVSQKVPSIMLALAAGNPEAGYCYPQHHPKVRFDEGVLADGSAVYAYAAAQWLESQG